MPDIIKQHYNRNTLWNKKLEGNKTRRFLQKPYINERNP